MSIAEKLNTIAKNEPKVYNAGYSKAESDFWDGLQNFGNRTDYEYCFFHWKGAEYIRPKYKVVPDVNTRILSMFNGCSSLKIVESEYFDLSNVTLTDTASSSSAYQVFKECYELEILQDIGIQAGGYYWTFSDCQKLHTIAVLRCKKEGVYTSVLRNCFALENITIEGTIGQNGFNVSQSNKLTHDSLMSIINALYDYKAEGSTATYTLTLGTTNLNKLTEAEQQIATDKGWTLL